MKLKMLCICMLFFGLFGCKDTEEDADVLQFSQKVVTFGDAAESQTVLISGTRGWQVSCEADWCFLDPATDNEGGMFSVMVTQNEALTARAAVIRVTAGNCIEEIDVVQAGKKTSLALSNSALKVFDLNERCVVLVTADKPWTSTVSGSWLKVVPASGKGSQLVKIVFPKNTSASERAGVVTFVAGDDSRTFDLIQEAATFDDRLHDSLALVAVYHSFNGPDWGGGGRFWLTEAPLEDWNGVTLENGRVTHLTVGPTYTKPSQGFPEEIKYLTKLQHCGFVQCWLTGSFPREFARCTDLISLSLRAKEATTEDPTDKGQMGGQIPLEFGCLPQFATLNFSGQKVTGPFPPEICYGNVFSSFSASYNLLSGTIPYMYTGSLSLSGNAEMTGTIPEAVCANWRAGNGSADVAGTKITPCTK